MCFRPPVAQKRVNKCPKCEKVNENTAAVCVECGAELAALPPPPGQARALPPRPPGPPPPPPRQPPKPPAPPDESKA